MDLAVFEPAQRAPRLRALRMSAGGGSPLDAELQQLLQLASVAALLRRPERRESVAWLQSLARALETNDPVLPVLDALARGRILRARRLSARRMFRVIGKEAADSGRPGPRPDGSIRTRFSRRCSAARSATSTSPISGTSSS